MPTFYLDPRFNPFKSLNRYFMICKIATLLFCLPWPLTLPAAVMALAVDPSSAQPTEIFSLWLLGLVTLVYPLIFLGIVLFAEKVLAPKIYATAAAVALVPMAVSVGVLIWLTRA